ncbi:MAG: cardiolipin synthase, partial [Lachnospiraceae bacterium]|nr:cardiolipin synthase [Lachnospiraceae bacterium]
TGDAVRSFTVMYLQMWNVSEKGSEDYEKYLKNITFEKPLYHDGFVIPYGETPTRSTEVGKTVYESIINNAVKYVHIVTPYFIIDREFLDSMRYAALRGVEVSMILPHIPDKKVVYYIARTFYPELLEAGINVYEYTPGFTHAKVFVSDNISATVGTINLDYRSFYHHFECGVDFYDHSVVAKVEEDFQNTLLKCQKVTLDYYKKLPLYQKMAGRVSRLFAPLL